MRTFLLSGGSAPPAPPGIYVGSGDSITLGSFLLPGESFGDQATDTLAANGFNVTYFNEGQSGFRSDQLLPLVATAVTPHFNPSARFKPFHAAANIVVIEWGTNDLFQGFSEASLRANQQSGVEQVRTAGGFAIIMVPLRCFQGGTPPTYEPGRIANTAYWLGQVGTGCDGIIAAADDPLFRTATSGGYLGDGLHPNATGAHAIGANYAYPAIKSIVLAS